MIEDDNNGLKFSCILYRQQEGDKSNKYIFWVVFIDSSVAGKFDLFNQFIVLKLEDTV